MNNDHKRSLRDLFLEAVEINDVEERARFLEAACAGDKSLRHRVDELLEEEEIVGLPPTSKRTAFFHEEAQPGAQIGQYDLIELVGEGGCGTVFKAAQKKPVRRHVALKVIKLGMDTEETVNRFEAERQALAMMDHPHIAQVYEAGATQSGRPYFVMELVEGVKVTEYSRRNKLNVHERLRLFLKICQAVNHAHQKGIIHRDLKPSNILVSNIDGECVPKIIDFGIAKAMEGRLVDQTIYTAFNHLVGTPAYMSPEQITLNSAGIDTRTDIYCLGVLLYELLTGQPPFASESLLNGGLDRMRKVIVETEPTRPSTQILLVNKERRNDSGDEASRPKSITRSHPIDRDLDWITVKCLEKETQRRYETVNALALDIQRYLADEPISARPPSLCYRITKSFRRNQTAYVAGAMILTILIAGGIFSAWQFHQKGQTLQRAVAAETKESKLRQSAEFRAYASDMNIAWEAFEKRDYGRARRLIERHRPSPGEPDLRGWEWRYLWDQTRSDALHELCRLSTPVRTLTISHDRRWLAVGGLRRGGLEIWDLASRERVARLAEDSQNFMAVFSPAGPLLAYTTHRDEASTKARGHVHLWDVESRKETFRADLLHECFGLAFSRDGNRLVTSVTTNGFGDIISWQVSDEGHLARLRSIRASHLGLERWVNDFAATPDLRFVAYGADRGRVRIVDLQTEEEQIIESDPFAYQVNTLAFSPDSRKLAYTFGLAESVIRLRDVIAKEDIGVLERHTAHVTALRFTADGKRLISSSADKTIRIWDVPNQQCLSTLRGSREDVTQIALMPGETRLISGAQDGTVNIWDLTKSHSRQEYLSFEDKVRTWRFAPDSRSLITVNADGVARRRWGECFEHAETLLELESERLMLSRWGISKDGALVGASYPGGVTEIWNLTTRLREHRLIDPKVKGTTARVYPGPFYEEGRIFSTVDTGNSFVRLWDLRKGTIARSWSPKDPPIAAPEGFYDAEFISTGAGGRITMRSTRDDKPRFVKQLDYIAGRDAALSPNNQFFAVSSNLGFVNVWETQHWKKVARFEDFRGRANAIAFSPDGRRLAMLDSHGGLYLCDTASWRRVFSLKGPGLERWHVQWSPDGNAIGMSDDQGTLTIWRVPPWEAVDKQRPPEP